MPGACPSLTVPDPSLGDLDRLVLAAVAISLVAFADTGVLSRSYAAKLGDRVDQDQELLALGAGNVAAGFFQGFPISSSSSRTPVAEAAGARTQLTGVVGALRVGPHARVRDGLFRNLPTATLAAVVVASVVGLVDLPALRWLLRVHRTEFVLALVAAPRGRTGRRPARDRDRRRALVLTLLWRAWHPYVAVLGRVDGVKGYHDTERHPEARQIPGLVLYRFDAPLFFANADTFRSRDPRGRGADPSARFVVVAAEPITDVDSTAADVLVELDRAARADGRRARRSPR